MRKKTCRLCLSEDKEFYGLFDFVDSDSLRIVDEINHLLNVRIYEDDKLPRSICSKCYKILEFFKEFRLTCLKVNNFLLEQAELWSHLDEERFLEVIKTRRHTTPNPEDIEASNPVIENVEDTYISMENDKMSLNVNFPEFPCNFRGENHETGVTNNIYDIENKVEEYNDMPALVSVDVLQPKKSCATKEYSDGQHSALIHDKNSSIMPEEYLPKSEEIILSESDTEIPNDETEDIGDNYFHEQYESNAEFVTTISNSSSELNDTVIELPDKIYKYETDFNKAILDTLFNMQNNGIKLSNSIVKETAKKIARERGNSNFTASNGWMISFYKRFYIEPHIDEIHITANNLQARTISNRFIIRYCCDEVNERTFNACESILKSGAELSAKLIQNIASQTALDEGITEFIATTGWLNSFRRRYVVNLRGRKITMPY